MDDVIRLILHAKLIEILLIINICLTAFAVGAIYKVKRRFFTKKGWTKFESAKEKEKV